MWIFRLVRSAWCLGIIFWSYVFQGFLRRALPRSARIKARAARVHARNADRAYRTCIKLRGIYIKLGQVLSVMGTFLPPPYVVALEQLQDAVPPRRYRSIARTLQKNLGARPEDVFASFERVPIAAASLSQVHRAVTKDGQTVAVKVLYPHIRKAMRIDMRVLRAGARFYKRFFLRLEQIDRVLDQLQEMLERETDFENEARCITRMNTNFVSDPDVLLPRVLPELSSKYVLTMTFMTGAKINNHPALAELGLDPPAVATKLVQSFYKSLFVDRFFHADPHPGNFFVQRGERGQPCLVILDLGSATEVRPQIADGLATSFAASSPRIKPSSCKASRRWASSPTTGTARCSSGRSPITSSRSCASTSGTSRASSPSCERSKSPTSTRPRCARSCAPSRIPSVGSTSNGRP